jgi:hypothetical protein
VGRGGWDGNVVQGGVEEAIREENLGVTECIRIDAEWSFGEESADVLGELIDSGCCRKKGSTSNHLPFPPHRDARSVISFHSPLQWTTSALKA